MQKVLRRTALAKAQYARKEAARANKLRSTDRKLRQQDQVLQNEVTRSSVYASRRARREDWLLGPLAPRRDVGDLKDTYGTVSPRRLRGVTVPKDKRIDYCLEVGDRVVIVEEGHKDRGKISELKDVMDEQQQCMVQGLNLVS